MQKSACIAEISTKVTVGSFYVHPVHKQSSWYPTFSDRRKRWQSKTDSIKELIYYWERELVIYRNNVGWLNGWLSHCIWPLWAVVLVTG